MSRWERFEEFTYHATGTFLTVMVWLLMLAVAALVVCGLGALLMAIPR